MAEVAGRASPDDPGRLAARCGPARLGAAGRLPKQREHSQDFSPGHLSDESYKLKAGAHRRSLRAFFVNGTANLSPNDAIIDELPRQKEHRSGAFSKGIANSTEK